MHFDFGTSGGEWRVKIPGSACGVSHSQIYLTTKYWKIECWYICFREEWNKTTTKVQQVSVAYSLMIK